MYNLILITNILRILDEKDMTKSELAEKAGVSISFFTDLTNDKAKRSQKRSRPHCQCYWIVRI